MKVTFNCCSKQCGTDQNPIKMNEIKFNMTVNESINGMMEEEVYRGVTILGHYSSEYDSNEGYRALISGRKQIRNFNYSSVVHMEIAI